MISHVLKSRLEALNLQSSNLSDKFILCGMQGQLCWHCSCAKFEFVRQVDFVWDARTVLFLHYSFAKFELGRTSLFCVGCEGCFLFCIIILQSLSLFVGQIYFILDVGNYCSVCFSLNRCDWNFVWSRYSFAKLEFVRQVYFVWDARNMLFLHYLFAKFEFVGQVYFVWWYARTCFCCILFCKVRDCRTRLFYVGC